jgi:hypothetical protein
MISISGNLRYDNRMVSIEGPPSTAFALIWCLPPTISAAKAGWQKV